jgi:hypothetical protein
MPRLSKRLPCVRARFEAVEIPLKRIKKSRNVRKKSAALREANWKNLASVSYQALDNRRLTTVAKNNLLPAG